MALGLAGGLYGISLALYQRDIKRILAYSSIENVGLIILGIGVGFWGRAIGDEHLAVLGLTGGLLHVWNHVVMKGLMFLAAGSVLHGTGTKDLERLGGLLKTMPVTGTVMMAGAVAIAGLPPMNGFVSEWLIYLGLIQRGLSGGSLGALNALLMVGLVALIGGLAGLCFVRLVGIGLLGQARGPEAEHAHESSRWMTMPLVFLAMVAVMAAVFPNTVAGVVSRVIADLPGGTPAVAATTAAATEGALAGVGAFNVLLWLVVGAVTGLSVLRKAQRQIAVGPTWGCGYAAPTARMQYTAGSFSHTVADGLLPRFLRSRVTQVAPRLLFPAESRFSSEMIDPFTRTIYEPFLQRWGDRFARLRWMQQGSLHLYLFYILFATVVGLAWISVFAGDT
jgi:NADH:ubiquinone oxidoreductase subunit 5 (subunit L)/multisubunit Na+/H+ antiporter MnhA subunit